MGTTLEGTGLVPPQTMPTPPKRPRRWPLLVAVAAVALSVGAGAGIASQSGTIDAAESRTKAVQVQADAAEKQVDDLTSDLASTKNDLSGAESEAARLRNQVASCDRAIDLGVDAEKVLQDKVDNVLYDRSVAEFFRLSDRYQELGERWVIAANECTGDDSWTFD